MWGEKIDRAKIETCISNPKDKLLSSGHSVLVKTTQNQGIEVLNTAPLVKKGLKEIVKQQKSEVEREKEKQP